MWPTHLGHRHLRVCAATCLLLCGDSNEYMPAVSDGINSATRLTCCRGCTKHPDAHECVCGPHVSGVQADVDSARVAKQLGYLLFFNLKRTDAALTVSEKDIEKASRDAGLKDSGNVWRLFSRDGDHVSRRSLTAPSGCVRSGRSSPGRSPAT